MQQQFPGTGLFWDLEVKNLGLRGCADVSWHLPIQFPKCRMNIAASFGIQHWCAQNSPLASCERAHRNNSLCCSKINHLNGHKLSSVTGTNDSPPRDGWTCLASLSTRESRALTLQRNAKALRASRLKEGRAFRLNEVCASKLGSNFSRFWLPE